MATTRKQPQRTCIGCGELKNKKDLIRVLRTPENEYTIDATGRKNGRGAYICHNAECLRLARKARRFEKSFSCKIEESVYEVMENELRSEPQNG